MLKLQDDSYIKIKNVKIRHPETGNGSENENHPDQENGSVLTGSISNDKDGKMQLIEPSQSEENIQTLKPESTDTGDTAQIFKWFLLGGVSLIALIFLLFWKGQKYQK